MEILQTFYFFVIAAIMEYPQVFGYLSFLVIFMVAFVGAMLCASGLK